MQQLNSHKSTDDAHFVAYLPKKSSNVHESILMSIITVTAYVEFLSCHSSLYHNFQTVDEALVSIDLGWCRTLI